MKKTVTYVLSCFLFLGLSIGNTIELEDLPSPYNTVKLMPYRHHGWHANHGSLSHLINTFNVQTIIEVGSWMGVSTLDMANMLPSNGKIYAVDTWDGSPNETHDPEMLRTLYDQFLSNVIHQNQTHKIIPIRLESTVAAKEIGVIPDLIYIDATHTYEANYADLNAWFPLVQGHGILCGDDLQWGDKGVERAVYQFAKEKNLTVHTNGWFWWLKENE